MESLFNSTSINDLSELSKLVIPNINCFKDEFIVIPTAIKNCTTVGEGCFWTSPYKGIYETFVNLNRASCLVVRLPRGKSPVDPT